MNKFLGLLQTDAAGIAAPIAIFLAILIVGYIVRKVLFIRLL